jgi:hypothetical protein
VAALRLILRFRELTPGVDTIFEHEAVLKRSGFVWWGWWKKEAEQGRDDDLAELQHEIHARRQFDAWLIDTSAERMHRATISDVRLAILSGKERKHVPRYYRDRGAVAAWFKVTSIHKDVPYDLKVESVIGQDTLAVIEDRT